MAAAAAADDNKSPVQLEHAVGYTGHHSNTVYCHPKHANVFVHALGAIVTIADARDPHHQAFLRGHDSEVTAVDMSASGKLVASASKGVVIVWNAKKAKQIVQLAGMTAGEPVKEVRFSPDDRLLAAVGERSFIVWDLETGERLTGEGAASPVDLVAWAPVGVGVNDRSVYSLATATGAVVRSHVLEFDPRYMEYRMQTTQCAFPSRGLVRRFLSGVISDDGKYLYCGTVAGDLIMFDLIQARYCGTLEVCGSDVKAIVLVGSNRLLAGGGDGLIRRFRGEGRVWEADGEAQAKGKVVAMSTAADQASVFVGTNKGILYRLSVEGLELAELSESHVTTVHQVAFGERTEDFVTISAGGKLFIWDIVDYVVKTRVRPRNAGKGRCCRVVAEQNMVLTGWEDGSMRAFALDTGKELWVVAGAHKGAVTTVDACPKYFVSGGKDGVVRLWTVGGHAYVSEYIAHQGAVRKVLIDNQRNSIIHSCGDDRAVISYNVKSEARVHNPHQITDGHFTDMVQLKDGEGELVTADSKGTLLVWDCDYTEPQFTIQDASRLSINGLSLSPDGKLIAVAGDDHLVKVYAARGRGADQVLASCLGHSGPVMSVAWSPDQRQLVSVGFDCATCVWNAFL